MALGVTFILNPVVAGAVPVGAGDGTVVPLRNILRACDFNQIPGGAAQNSAAASAIIRVTGGTVSAEVHLAEAGARQALTLTHSVAVETANDDARTRPNRMANSMPGAPESG